MPKWGRGRRRRAGTRCWCTTRECRTRPETAEAGKPSWRAAGRAAEAIAVWQRAARLPSAAAADRIAAAISWGAQAAELGDDWAQAMEGMATAVDLLPLLARRGLDRAQRDRLLADCAGLAQDAAAAALAAGRPEQAVELLERGRSVLWSQLLEQNTELDALRVAAPALAARLDQVRSALDTPDDTGAAALPAVPPFTGPGAGTPPPAVPPRPVWLEHHDAADRRMAPAQEWEGLVEEVRSLPGFENFLRRPRLRELQSALPGPVVLVNVSTLRCDALIVTGSAVRVVPLPGLTARDAQTRVTRFLTVLGDADRAVGIAARMVREQTLLDILEWLWDAVADRVLEALHLTSPIPLRGPGHECGGVPLARSLCCPSMRQVVPRIQARTSRVPATASWTASSARTPRRCTPWCTRPPGPAADVGAVVRAEPDCLPSPSPKRLGCPSCTAYAMKPEL